MQKIFFITYADQNYVKQQFDLTTLAKESGRFDVIIPWSIGNIMQTDWYEKNKELFEERGIGDDRRVKPGFFLWKPFIISETLKLMDENDILMYIDCGDILTETQTLREFLIEMMKDKDFLLTNGAYPNYMYTKRDAFVLMNADEEKYHKAIQLEAGIFVCKSTIKTFLVVEEWLKYCQDRRIISNDENVMSLPNLEGFKANRWDQSILSILKIRYDLFSDNSMRRFVSCNKRDN